MRTTHRPVLRRALLIAPILLGLTATTTVVTATTASARPASVCDWYAEHGILAPTDELVHTWWAFGHAAGCW